MKTELRGILIATIKSLIITPSKCHKTDFVSINHQEKQSQDKYYEAQIIKRSKNEYYKYEKCTYV